MINTKKIYYTLFPALQMTLIALIPLIGMIDKVAKTRTLLFVSIELVIAIVLFLCLVINTALCILTHICNVCKIKIIVYQPCPGSTQPLVSLAPPPCSGLVTIKSLTSTISIFGSSNLVFISIPHIN